MTRFLGEEGRKGGRFSHTGSLTLRQGMRIPLEINDRQLLLLLVLFLHEDAGARLHGGHGRAVHRGVDPFGHDPAVRVLGDAPAVARDEADHAHGPVLAVGLVVEADDVLAVREHRGGRQLRVRGAADAGPAVDVLQVAQLALLPLAVFVDDVLQDVVVVQIDHVLLLIEVSRYIGVRGKGGV